MYTQEKVTQGAPLLVVVVVCVGGGRGERDRGGREKEQGWGGF